MSARSKMAAAPRVDYRFDEANRLVVTDHNGPTDRLRPSRVIEGAVATDRFNRLVYRVDTSTATSAQAGPHQYNLDGTWALTRDHTLQLTLHETKRGRRQRLFLKGELIEAQAHALTFALQQHGLDGRRTSEHLSLRGRWQADRQNRLTFLVERASGVEDRLTFQGGWTVGTHHELLYRYRQRTATSTHTLRFAGVWDLNRANRLVYRVDGSTDSAFDFRVSLQRPSLNAREGRLVYQVGIGLAGGRTVRQRVVLFGTWKVHRELSVSFEIPYAQGRREAIHFNATYAFARRNEIAVELLDHHDRPLGISVTFSRQFLNDTQLFLRLRKAGEEAEVLGGVQVRF